MLASWALGWAVAASAFEGYLATAADRALLEKAIAGALKVAPEVFPDADMGAVDVLLLDAKFVRVYSRKPHYPFERLGTWGRYHVYRIAHGGTPLEHESWGCRAGHPSVSQVEHKRIMAERVVRCAPWGTFRRRQEARRSDYATEEGYLATMIHEFGHAYEDMRWRAPTPAMTAIRERVGALEGVEGLDRGSILSEAFAQYCELAGARRLYPAQYRRLMKTARGGKDRGEHGVGLRVAAEVLRDAATSK